MKLQNLFAATSLLLTASLSFAQSSKISTQYPNFYKPGYVTVVSVRAESQLPSDYQGFAKIVTEQSQANAQSSGDTSGQSRADELCSKYPSTRACYHARYFEAKEQPPKVASRADEICAKFPSTRDCVHARYFEQMHQSSEKSSPFAQLNIVRDLLMGPGNYTNFLVSYSVSTVFNEDLQKNTEIITAVMNKLTRSTHQLSFVFVPTSTMVVMSSNVRVVDDTCGFVGTPEQYLVESTCTAK